MSLLPVRKKCPVCGKWYNWNPDAGVASCPYCGGISRAVLRRVLKMLKKW